MRRRDFLAGASLLALSMAAKAEKPAAEEHGLRADGRESLDEGWRFFFGHLDDIDRDYGFGLFQRTFAKQGVDPADPAQTPDGVKAALLDFDDSAWKNLNLPHDWAVELPFVNRPAHTRRAGDAVVWDDAAGHGFKPVGRDYPETSVGWYRRQIVLSQEDRRKRIRLDFDGVFESAIVFFNGYIVKEHRGGYVPFSVDLSDFLNTDDRPNILAVRVDASLGEGWYYEGAGIYRHVWLVRQHDVHIAKDGIVVRSQTNGEVHTIVSIANAADTAQRIRVAMQVGTDAGGWRQVATQAEIPAGGVLDVPMRTAIAAPRLWSLDDPHQYECRVTLTDAGGTPQDTATQLFGFRSIHFDPNLGFFLNGKPVKIKGVCNHQDHAGVGVAVPDALWAYRIACMKEMGCNAIRTAHNPPAPEFLDACDRMGMLVVDENRQMTSSEQGLHELRTMIVRDRNHPSIILWSIGNEEPQQSTRRGVAIATSMKKLIRELDPTRGMTAAIDKHQGEGISTILDVMGFNYGDEKIDAFHLAFPSLPIIGTETASALGTRGEYTYDARRHVVPAYDVEHGTGKHIAEQWWTHFDAKPYISGGFIWSGFDYRGEPTPWQELPSISSNFGVVDTCGFPKDAFHYYRSWWQAEPVLHLFPHWNWEPGARVSVWVYSNCESVELFLNGSTLGRQTMRKDSHLEWLVPYAPGKIEAVGYREGKIVMRSARHTAAKAAAIALTSNRTELTSDGKDCAVIRAEILDQDGIPVPRAANFIQFAVDGPARIIGVGNGDPNCHEPDRASQRSAYNGLCCAIVQASNVAGPLNIYAHAEGLTSGSVQLLLNRKSLTK